MVDISEIELVHIDDVANANDILWELLVERSEEDDPSVNISHRKLPTRQAHDRWVETWFTRFAHFYLIRDKIINKWAGYISLTTRNEIGIVLFVMARGKGIGTKALETFLRTTEPLAPVPGERSGNFLANINPRNERSIKLFARAGFTHIQNTYALGKDDD